MANYSIVRDGDKVSLTVFDEDGLPTPVPQGYHKFDELVTALIAGDDKAAFALLNVPEKVAGKLQLLSERVSLSGNSILFDGDPIEGAIAEHIIKILSEGEEPIKWQSLVNFLEKVQTNPEAHSREQLYVWLRKHGFTITADGDFLAYKGVDPDLRSVNKSGSAYVDGVLFQGGIPNTLGSIITMPRSTVQHNPRIGCSTGLHAGTWDYARKFVGYDGVVLLVKINPRDVVSVPTDSGDQKLRVSRYQVIQQVKAAVDATTYSELLEKTKEAQDEAVVEEVTTTDAVEEEEDFCASCEEEEFFCDNCGIELSWDTALCDSCQEEYDEDDDDEGDDDPLLVSEELDPDEYEDENEDRKPTISDRLRGMFGSW